METHYLWMSCRYGLPYVTCCRRKCAFVYRQIYYYLISCDYCDRILVYIFFFSSHHTCSLWWWHSCWSTAQKVVNSNEYLYIPIVIWKYIIFTHMWEDDLYCDVVTLLLTRGRDVDNWFTDTHVYLLQRCTIMMMMLVHMLYIQLSKMLKRSLYLSVYFFTHLHIVYIQILKNILLSLSF